MNIDELLILVRRLYMLGQKSVKFEYKQTKCPICEYLQVYKEGSVQVVTTRGKIRYCKCKKCGTKFKAVK